MSRRLALLVATYRYQDAGLRQLTAPGRDAEALAEVLRNPDIAGFEVTILINEPNQAVGRAIGALYRNRSSDDLTLLYFTGHGLKDDHGRLYLAMTDTARDSLLFTALPADQIHHAIESCSSRQNVLVLDCCYSGAFSAGWVSKSDPEVHTLERFRGKGRVVLTASDATQYSFEGNEIIGQGTRSVFTRFLVEGLATGDADRNNDGDITLDELYDYVYDRVVAERPQQRPKMQANVEGHIVIARNVHWSTPAHVRNAMESSIATDHLTALDALAPAGTTVIRREHDDRRFSAFVRPVLASIRLWLRRRAVLAASATLILVVILAANVVYQWAVLPPTIVVGDGPVGVGAAVTPDGSRIYVANESSDDVSVIDVASNSVIYTIGVGDGPYGIAISPNGDHVYVTNRYSNTVSAIDTTSHAVTTVPVGEDPVGVAVTRDGGEAYVANSSSGTVSVIATSTDSVIDTIGIGGAEPDPVGVVADPVRDRVYVTTDSYSDISVVDSARHEVIDTVSVSDDLYVVSIMPDGNHIYVTHDTDDYVSAIDLASGAVTKIPVGDSPVGMAISPNGERVYVTNRFSGDVSVIDTAANRVITTVPIGRYPWDQATPWKVAVAPGNRAAYVTDYDSDTVSIIDTSDG